LFWYNMIIMKCCTALIFSIIIIFSIFPAYAQDSVWTSALEGWVDDTYYPTMFLGGNYITKVSLADIDADGDLDMFIGGGYTGSLTFFRNARTPQEPDFKLEYEEFPGLRRGGRETGIVDADFADLDGDGDLDAVISWDLSNGGYLYWNDGTPQEPNFVRRYPLGPIGSQSNATLVDIDNDGDLDCFSGAGYNNLKLLYFENIGADTLPDFILRNTSFQGLDFGVPFNFDMGDLDGDSDYDLVVCEIPGPIAYYENTGTRESPNFTLITSNLLPWRDTTDWMETPELADIDNDGDLDLLLSGGYAHLCYIENVGDRYSYSFRQRSDTSYYYLKHLNSGTWMANAADINGDGKQDLNLGTSFFLNNSTGNRYSFTKVDGMSPTAHGAYADLDADGDLDHITGAGHYVAGINENVGSRFWPEWAHWRQLFPSNNNIEDIFSVAPGDLDADGDIDLLLGNGWTGTPVVMRNDGTPQAWNFTYADTIYLPQFEYWGHYHLALVDIDRDGDLDLFLSDTGSNSERLDVSVRLFFYRNDGTPQVPSWTFVSSDFQNIILNHRQSGLTVCPIDIEGDGDFDLAFSVAFGLQLYLNPLNPPANISDGNYFELPSEISLSAYPNPFNSATTITLLGFENAEIEIYDITGRLITTLHTFGGQALWDASAYSSGLYFARLAGEKAATIKLILLK
jgi:hypothetical protein